MKFKTLATLIFCTLLGFSCFFWYIDEQFTSDWSLYFELLSFFVRSAVWKFHALPIYNPWRCGGSDLLLNPQTRIVSPLVVFDLAFSPQVACLAALVFFALIGGIGTFKLLRYLNVSEKSAIVGSLLFINCSWFSLHFTEGHISFSEMQLLPLIFLCGLTIYEKRSQWLLTLLLAIILLDGAIQAVIYAGLVLVCAFLFLGKASFKKIDLKHALKMVFILILVTVPKTLPVLLTLKDRVVVHDTSVMSGRLLFEALLNPLQGFSNPATKGYYYVFHEFGCYLGWTALLIFVGLLFSKLDRKKNAKYFLLVLFWFWTGSGLLTPFNPWQLFQKLPILNQAHIQSRLFVILFLFFVIVVVRSLDKFGTSKARWWILASLLLAECYFVRFHITSQIGRAQKKALGWNDFIASHTIADTVDQTEGLTHILDTNRGATSCDDRLRIHSFVRHSKHPEYKGEVYLTEGKGEAKYLSVAPGEVRVQYAVTEPSVVSLNLNHHWGWHSKTPNAQVVSKGQYDLIRFKVEKGTGEAVLQYRPSYLPYCLFFGLLGWILLLVEFAKTYKAIKLNNRRN